MRCGIVCFVKKNVPMAAFCFVLFCSVLEIEMISLIELLAVITSGIYGMLLARKKNMDFVGVFSIAFVTAFGGGTLRDLFLDRHPLFWIEHDHYPVIVFGLAILISLWKSLPKWVERILPIPDALGMGLFSLAGTAAAINAGCSPFIASLMGVITGTFGGVMGDVFCNEVPSLFRSAPLYATCSFIGCWVYLLMQHFGLVENWNLLAGISTIVIIRLIALRWNLQLPQYDKT